MLSLIISADRLFLVITSSTINTEEKLKSINELKTHVKKDFVDIKQVPKYVEALSIAVDISDSGILSSSFSVLSHLVKRVSMQDPSGAVLRSQGYLALPIIINRLGDAKTNIRNSSKRALEAYWFSAPKEVEESIVDIAFHHKNSKVVKESITWLHHIITNVNPHFKINSFLPHIVSLMRSHLEEDCEGLIEGIKLLLKDYYSLKHNRLYKFDLLKEMDVQNISINLKESIVGEIGTYSSHLLNEAAHNMSIEHNFILAGNTKITVSKTSREKKNSSISPSLSSTLTRPKSRTNFHNYSKSILPSQEDELGPKQPVYDTAKLNSNHLSASVKSTVVTNDHSSEPKVIISSEIEEIVAKSLTYKIDSSISQLDMKNIEEFSGTINSLFPAFEGKETEFNWGMREKNIVKLRSIIRGNATSLFTDELTTYLREYSESICKAITSLRTTLSSHACHLLKECAMLLQENFDPLVDAYVPHLIKLCSATKHIASANANMALCAIFINVPFNYKLLHRILASANDKNVQPRSYSGIWLQIIIVRFHDISCFSHHGSNSNSGVEISIKILSRLLSDPNPNVRQVAKDTYWCFWNKFPSEAESLLAKLDTNIVKAIERSRPRNISSKNQPSTLSSLSAKKQRPSIKESIIARNKELRSKQKDRGSLSRSLSRGSSTSSPSPIDDNNSLKVEKQQFSALDSGRLIKLGVAKRSSSTSSFTKMESRQNSLTRNISESSSTIPKNDGDASSENHVLSMDSKIRANEAGDILSEQTLNMKRINDVNSFDKQSDPILNFLSSNQKELISEGISLLKYAIMGDEDLSSEVNTLLKKISVKNQDLLQPLFLGSESLFKKSYQFFLSEDFLRVCCILIHPIDEKVVDLIISTAEVDDIYASACKLISYTTNLNNIVDDNDMTMQIIRYKSIIIRLVIRLLNEGLNKIPISDSHFLKLITNLFELVSLVRSTGLYKSFCELLTKLYSINPTLFTSELQMMTITTRDEVECVVGIDGILDLNQGQANNYSTLYELTKVVPGNNLGKLSPLKAPSDLTMVVPTGKELVNNTGNDYKQTILETDKEYRTPPKGIDNDVSHISELNSATSKTKTNSKKVIEDDLIETQDAMDVDQDESDELHHNHSNVLIECHSEEIKEQDRLNFQPDIMPSFDESENVFVDLDSDSTMKKPDLFTKYVQKENPSELVENFAQVQITELSKNGEHNENQIKTFIDKVDPLNKVSLKNRPICIYEDGSLKGSPQKVKDYSYTELNWFNFQLVRLSSNKIENTETDDCVEGYKSLCHKLSSKSIEGREFVSILNFLQGIQTSNMVFAQYFQSQGHSLIEDSLWKFFDNLSTLSLLNKLSGLILLKQLLINRFCVNLDRLWSLLVGLSFEARNSKDELSLAIGETFDEMLVGLFSSEVIFSRILSTLEASHSMGPLFSLPFILECLSKILNTNTISFLVNEKLIVRIDEVLGKHMNNNDVEIRRYVILSYGRLLKAARISSSTEVGINTESELFVMDDIMQRLSIPQKKLIEYYSHE